MRCEVDQTIAASIDRIHILLIEDSASDTALIVRHVQRCGFDVQFQRVDTANGFLLALNQLPWDIILCDYSMPMFSADEALAILHKSSLDIPFLVVSGTISEESIVELIRAGAADYILKSNLPRLVPAIRRELKKTHDRRAQVQSEVERTHLEAQLKQSERRYQMLFDSFTDAVLVLKLDGHIIDVNQTAVTQMGLSRDVLLTKSLWELDHSNTPIATQTSRLDRICKVGNGTHEIVTHRTDGSVLVFDVHLRVIDYSGLPAIIAVARDISERKRVEEEHRRLNNELESRVTARTLELERSTAQLALAKAEAERSNRAKSQFLASMSHEIRTPLNAILGFSQILLRAHDLPISHRESISTIHRSGDHLLGLINDILEMSSIESGRVHLIFTTFDLPSLVNDVATLFRLRAESKGLTLTVDMSSNLPNAVVSDEKKLRQILINLLGNAVKFTERGGIVWRIQKQAQGDEARWITQVEDTGPGIHPQDIPRLFDKFIQSSTGLRAGGTGLGLSISREFARLLGGDIQAQSMLGKGSCFTLELPLIEGTTASIVRRPEHYQFIQLKPECQPCRILIVDDQEDSRKVLMTILTTAGFYPCEASGALEGLALFDSFHPDAVLMDLRMPIMNGIEVTRRLRRQEAGKKVPIIAVTASAFDEDRKRALEGGMNDFIGKPFHDTDVLESLGRHLGVEYLYSDNDLDVTPAPILISSVRWTKADLTHVPRHLLEDLRTATVAAEFDKVLRLVDLLEEYAPLAAREFRRLVHAFDYQTLLDRLDEAPAHG
jgi:PAS domain S-box-containing protein